jgi:hypothetical protein
MEPVLGRLFADGLDGCDAYRACRDHGNKEEIRAKFEGAFAMHAHLCPEGPERFASEFRRDWCARAWELYLMAVLSDAGMCLERAERRGPDILIRLPSGNRCWVEAVVPSPGTGADRVFQPPQGNWAGSYGPVDKLLVRYRSVLEDKLIKILDYRRAGIVDESEPVMIAVGSWGIPGAWAWDRELPALVKAVYPVGEPVLVVPIDSPEPERVEVRPRWVVRKTSGAPVGTNFFLEARTAGISAVMYTRTDVWNVSWDATRALGIVHNVVTNVPLERGVIPSRVEWWVEGQQLQRSGGPAETNEG